MIVVRDADTSKLSKHHSVVAIGVFDGLHRGHQAVIEVVLELSRQRSDETIPSVITFDPHPASVLAPERAPRLLGTLAQRLEGFEALGFEQVRVLTFDRRLASESAPDFIRSVIVGEMRAADVVVGEDFRFGHDRTGDVALLRVEGPRYGFDVHAAPTFGEPRWSSSAVRASLEAGDVERAKEILGRRFVLRGGVEHGDARGAELGFATANVATAARQLVPLEGVYAGAARTPDGSWWPAAISIGTRPQFYDDGPLLVEVHMPGLVADLYGASLDVAFSRRLRAQEVFSNVAELIEQIELDVAQTIEIFKKFTTNGATLLE